MANQGAWQSGFDLAANAIHARRQRKQQLADEERQYNVATLYDTGHRLAAIIPTLSGADREKAMNQLTDVEQSIAAIYHPDRNPGAIQKDWNMLAGLITRKPRPIALSVSYDSATTPALTLPAQGGIAGDGPTTIPGSSVDVRPTQEAMTSQQRQQIANRLAARWQAQLDVASAGSPEEEAQADSAKKLASITQAVKDYGRLNPNATPEEKTAFFNDVVAKAYGFTQRPVWKAYTGPNGQKDWLDITQPVPAGWTATGTETTDTRKRKDYDDYVKQHPDYTAPYEQWIAEQGQLARRAVPTSRDDRFIDIERRRQLGQPLSDDDKAYSAAYDLYVQKRITNPAVARAAAFGASRYVSVLDPANPEKVVFMRAGDAAQAGAGTPQSIGFQIDKAVTRYMTAGQGATNINYFNTSIDHLKLLSEAADALNNGDIQRLNQAGNAFARETGDPAPTNFETVKSAVAGELAKTFKGTGATDQEIAEINQAINQSESPDQLHSAINYYLRLMDGKLNALRLQYAQGKQGQPAFGGAGTLAAPAGGGGSQPVTGTRRFRDGATTYAIPPGDVQEFLKDHPRAQEVK